MIYTRLTKTAMKIAFNAHKDAVDQSGIPYVFHPFHVAESMTDETETAAALLHDVIEDTDITAEDLINMGISEEVVKIVVLLSKNENDDYFEYLEKVKKNPVAAKVKKADLLHNSDLSRFDTVTEKDLERQEKYLKAIEILSE